MELKVPYVKQPPGSFTCGPASATMVLKYFGHKVSYKQVSKDLFVAGSGITLSRLGSYFLTKGLDVTVQACPLGTAEKLCSSRRFTGEAGVTLLMQAAQAGATHKARRFPKEIAPLIRRGGGIVLKPIVLADLRSRIENNSLILPLVDLKCWAGLPRRAGHYNVVRGITERDSQVTRPHVYVSDPDLGSELFVTVEFLLKACNNMVGAMLYITLKAA